MSVKIRRKFPGNKQARGIHEFIENVRYTGSLLDKKRARKRRVRTEEETIQNGGARLEHAIEIT
jgi:hypothetical protein